MRRHKPTAPDAPKQDAYDIVNERIIAALEAGTIPWRKEWATSARMPFNAMTGKAYRGINPFLLWLSPFSDPRWATIHQINEMGGRVVKGSTGYPIVFFTDWTPKAKETGQAPLIEGETEEKAERRIPVLKRYSVFNICQTEGIIWDQLEPVVREHTPLQEAEAIVHGMPNAPTIAYGGGQAFYSPERDHVQIPPANSFRTAEAFYHTQFHELAHATGHPSRLNRPGITDADARFGTPKYAEEELVAEMTAAYLSNAAGIDCPPVIDNAAAYIANWLEAIKQDRKLLVMAASKATKAANLIRGIE